VNNVGEVYRPEDLVGEKKKPSDLSPNLRRVTPTTLQDVIREVRLLRAEVNKIKQVLRANGIAIE
jgi:predicted phosphatase